MAFLVDCFRMFQDLVKVSEMGKSHSEKGVRGLGNHWPSVNWVPANWYLAATFYILHGRLMKFTWTWPATTCMRAYIPMRSEIHCAPKPNTEWKRKPIKLGKQKQHWKLAEFIWPCHSNMHISAKSSLITSGLAWMSRRMILRRLETLNQIL